MASTREIRRRIRSVKNIGQITKAMELVSASKMRRAQDVAMAGRRYNFTMYQMLGNLISQADPSHHPLLEQLESTPDQKRTLMIVFGPDKGLCGALIGNMAREIARYHQAHPNTAYVTMGKRTRDVVLRLGGQVVADFPLHERPQLRHILPMTRLILQEYMRSQYHEVVIANSRYINTLQQQPRIHRLLPLSSQMISASTAFFVEPNIEVNESQEFLFEPGIEEVLNQLLPRFVEMTVFQSLLEAQASEHSARMIAMKNAGDNARDLQDELTLTYNQLRQASITAELAEIASAVAG